MEGPNLASSHQPGTWTLPAALPELGPLLPQWTWPAKLRAPPTPPPMLPLLKLCAVRGKRFSRKSSPPARRSHRAVSFRPRRFPRKVAGVGCHSRDGARRRCQGERDFGGPRSGLVRSGNPPSCQGDVAGGNLLPSPRLAGLTLRPDLLLFCLFGVDRVLWLAPGYLFFF